METTKINNTASRTNGVTAAVRVRSGETKQAIFSEIESGERERMLAQQSFKFKHRLGDAPSMSLAEIRKLVDKMLAEGRYDQIFYKTGKSMASGKYSDAEGSAELVNALKNFNTAGVWLRLTRVDEVTPQFGAIVEKLFTDLSDLYQQDIKAETWKPFLTLFVSSPGAYANYHMDHTWNFLFQISGRKSVHLYDPFDLEVLTEEDKEGWYMKNFTINPRAAAKDIEYDLGPGDGVHHPVNAPHWVQNGTEISVSLSIGFCLHKSNQEAKVYQANYLLRKLGLKPTPPNRSEWKDRAKVSFVSRWSDRTSSSLDGVVFSAGDRLRRICRIGSSEENQYEPK